MEVQPEEKEASTGWGRGAASSSRAGWADRRADGRSGRRAENCGLTRHTQGEEHGEEKDKRQTQIGRHGRAWKVDKPRDEG